MNRIPIHQRLATGNEVWHCPKCDCCVKHGDGECWNCKLEFELPAGVSLSEWKTKQEKEK